MRVMTEEGLNKLRKSLEAFAKALSDPDTVNNLKKINGLISAYGFGPEFLKCYTKSPA